MIPSRVQHSSLLFSPGDFQSLCKLVAIKENVKVGGLSPNLLTRGNKDSSSYLVETLYCKHIDFVVCFHLIFT